MAAVVLVTAALVGCGAQRATSEPDVHGGLTRAQAERAVEQVAAKFDELGAEITETLGVERGSPLRRDELIGSDTLESGPGWIARYVDPLHPDGEAVCVKVWGDASQPGGFDYIWQPCLRHAQ